MDAAAELDATTRYLRFPLTEDHRAPLQDGSLCPHCGGRRTTRWGRFSGRQRYRCRTCGRTFSTFTGTALYYLKKPQQWRRFLWCVDGRLTVRSTAAVVGVNKDTALRWRHRLLRQWRAEPRRKLEGEVEIGDFCVPYSEKGTRSVGRGPRRHGDSWSPYPFLQGNPVTVLVAWEGSGAVVLESLGREAVRPRVLEGRLRPRLGAVSGIVGCRGRFGMVARFANGIGVPYRQERAGIWTPRVQQVRHQLRAWLRPFHGVSTRRLNHYLEWYRRRGVRSGPTGPGDSTVGGSTMVRIRGKPGCGPRDPPRPARIAVARPGDWGPSV